MRRAVWFSHLTLLPFLFSFSAVQAQTQPAKHELVVYASGPYEVWGGSNGPEYNYYNVDLLEGYVRLGESSETKSFPGGYRYYVVATHSLFHLDAIKLPNGNYAGGASNKAGEYMGWGNVHRPWQFRENPLWPCDLIGSPLDYSDDHNISGPPDGLTDDVGIPPDCGSTGERYEGVVVVENKSKEFMITFDDGPIPGQTDSILLQLRDRNVDGEPVRAAFFMVGDPDPLYYGLDVEWNKGSVKAHPDDVNRVAGLGHVVGNHTQHHAWFPLWFLFDFASMEDFVKKEISDCNTAMEEALGEKNPPRIFRAPYLQDEDYPSAVYGAAQQLGFTVVGGKVVDEGWYLFPSAADVQKNAETELESWDEAEPRVLIFHDNRSVTYDNIGEIIKALQDEGYRLAHFDVKRIPKQTQRITKRDKKVVSGIAHRPIDLVITDPGGATLSKGQSQISDALYEELDTDGDGHLDDFFVVPEAKPGQYLIQVTPEPNALPDKTYSLEVDVNGESVVLAQDVLLRDIPQEPYTVVVGDSNSPIEGSEPVAHWMFDEGTGTVASDSAGTSPGTVYGAKWVDGHIGGALRFDGLDDYVDCGNAAALAPEKMTVAFWMFVEGKTSYQYVLGKTKDMFSQQDYTFSTGGDGRLEFAFGQAAGQRVAVKSKEALPLGQWVHVAATRDGSTASLYLNGQLETSVTYSFALTNKGQSLRIGSIGLPDPDWGGFFKGKIDDVRIYDKPLSAEEVQELHRQGSP